MKKWTRILAALLSLLMMLSLAACGSSVDSVVKNLLGKDADAIRQKDFQSPEEFYRAVEMRRMQEALGLTTGAANLDTFSADKLFLQNDLIVKLDLGVLDKGVQDLLRDSAGMDLSWAKSVGLSMTTGKQDYLNAMNLSVRVNDTDVVQGKVVIDNAGGNIYASVPELSEKAFSVNMNDTLRNLIGYRVDASGLCPLPPRSWAWWSSTIRSPLTISPRSPSPRAASPPTALSAPARWPTSPSTEPRC